ncbi:lymphocyte cytosolic protein 2a isoform X2 [Vanacampus margaritifer]
MNCGRVPSRSKVMEWSPQQLADYLRKMNLSDCDRTVLKNSINGMRFVNLTENDLQKFPKLYTPIISKLSADISKKEQKRALTLFVKKTMTPTFHEPVRDFTVPGDNSSDDDDDVNDYESPNSGGEDSGQSDYEKPNDDTDVTEAEHYELPPSEPLAQKLRSGVRLGDPEYIGSKDNRASSKGAPPAVCPRAPLASRPALSPRPVLPSRRSKPPSSSASIGRSTSSVKPPPPSRIDGIRETLPPRPTPPSRHGDSLPPGAGSLPLSVSSAPDVEGWDDDEFDDEDTGYENPMSGGEDSGRSADDDDAENDDTDWADNYEPPPTEPSEELTHKLFPALPCAEDDYVDQVSSRGPPAVSLRPPVSSLPPLSPPRLPGESLPGRDHTPHSARQPPPGKLLPGPPQIFRGNKPGRNSSPIRGPNTEERPSVHSRRPQVNIPDPPGRSKPLGPPPGGSSTSIGMSNSSVRPPPPSRFDGMREQTHSDAPKHNTFTLPKNLPPRLPPPGRHGNSLPSGATSVGSLSLNVYPAAYADNRSNFAGPDRFHPPPQKPPHTQGMDPRWYVGKVTRGQAEGYLKQVSKDGAYLVRDSSHQKSNQPYTLMVLHHNKVFNIQIRHEDKQFQLGTGLKAQESFSSVCDMINYHSQCHLLLIDAKKRCPGQQNQCLLSEPAGIYMTGPHGSQMRSYKTV